MQVIDANAGTAPDVTLDAKGLNCPLPILRARKALGGLKTGETMRVLSTDPGSVADFAAFCDQTGHSLLSSGEEAGAFFFDIRKC